MAEKLYPARQRCKTCRKGFDKTILAGLYCSYKCGGFPPPAKTVPDAPRGCKREVDGKWGYKVRYSSPDSVPIKYQNDPSTNIYLCDNCRTYHIGHSRPDREVNQQAQQLVRYVKDLKELGSVIERYMISNNIDKKVLAKKLKIPAIRITEIQQASPKANAMVLMRLLYELKLRVEITSISRKNAG